MSGRTLWVGAGGLMLLLAVGCSLDSFKMDFFASAPHHEHTLSGKVDVVAGQVQASLQGMGLLVNAKREGETIHLLGTTRAGKPFDLLLKRKTTSYGESTVVELRWQKDADEVFWMDFMNVMNRPANPGGFAPTGMPPGGQPGTITGFGAQGDMARFSAQGSMAPGYGGGQAGMAPGYGGGQGGTAPGFGGQGSMAPGYGGGQGGMAPGFGGAGMGR
jgi:hypothetical protein